MVRVARAMAMATKRMMKTDGNTMSTATKRAMANNGDNRGNGYGDEAGMQAMAATMAMRMGTAQRTWLLMLFTTGERGMMVVMGHGLCVSFCVCGETTKNKVKPKKCQCFLELLSCEGLAIDKPC